jgi:hypothetical protein
MGEIKVGILSRIFMEVSRKYEVNTLAAAAKMAYEIRDDWMLAHFLLVGLAAAGGGLGAS